jgi:integrase
VLSPDEVARLLRAIPNLKHRMVAMTEYGAGLRITEAVHLQLSDIDSDRMVITVRHGKGDVDRQVILSKVLLDALRRYWLAYKPALWLFEGKGPRKAVGGLHGPARDPSGQGSGQDHKAGHLTVPSSQLRHTPLGVGHGPARHPASARSPFAQGHPDLHPCCHRPSPGHGESPGYIGR